MRLFLIALVFVCVAMTFAAEPTSKTLAAPTKTEATPDGHVVLLIAFSWSDDPAALDLEKSFRYAATLGCPGLQVDVVKCGSPYEAITACDTLMTKDWLRFMVFAGDEGSAAAVALLSAEHKMPVLKVSSDPRPITNLSSYLFEFLPSSEAQAQVLGEYAVKTLGMPSAAVLSSQDARGRALADGFRRAVEKAGARIDTVKYYPPDATNVRTEVGEVFSAQERKERGMVSLETSLTPEERALAFGDSSGGEVLFNTTAADSTRKDTLKHEDGLFFTLTPDKIEAYANQLRQLPDGVMLLGNSSWVDLQALAKADGVTDGMYITVPLLPDVPDTTAAVKTYTSATGAIASEWAILGLDAGDFVGKIMATTPRSRSEVMKAIPGLSPYAGVSVMADFRSGHENKSARILRYEAGDLKIVK
jgi:ABC-type branched-subunit amino acid transport system substrate-binding protein